MSLRPPPEPPVSEAQVRRAWFRYLRETREAAPRAYEQVEQRAWARLTSNLAALGAPVPDRTGSATGSSD